jgi:hypothetical protein
MENYIFGLIGIGALMAASVVAFVIYRWRQEARVSRINIWVNDYLRLRYGELPARLKINCSHDTLWPVLVGFDTPGTGIRNSLQFACKGQQSAWFLLSEKVEQRQSD